MIRGLVLKRAFALTALGLLAACASAPQPALDVSSGVEVRKSPNDTREYRYIELPNRMRVLLVSDTTTDKSAAALAVYRGSFHEPENRAGLAHFLEHMLFIQTEAYPEVDGFQHFVSGHGGSSNAYTALDHTNYFFEVSPDAFGDALDRFAHFFIDPIISDEYAQREKNAVHSEYQLQIKDDGWRTHMVEKQALNPAHPASRFTIGSLQTLAGDIQADLLKFFDTHYSADQMGLVVLSDESLDALEARVRPLFGQIEDKNIGPDYPDVPMFTTDGLPAELHAQSLKQGAHLTFNFPLPDIREHYRNKPEQYVANLIGHEGEGSLYQLLSGKGWIESLSASVGEFDRYHAQLVIALQLTQAGKANRAAITDFVFQYIDMLRGMSPEAWLYKEQATVAELGFRYQEKSRPTSLVYQMAPRLDEYPPADLLVAQYLMEEFDADLIKDYLRYLTPANVLVEYVAPDVDTDQVERWFSVPYGLYQGPLPRDGQPAAGFSLPPPNPYLPDDLELKPADTADPELAIEAPGLDLWLDTDVRFGAPRASLNLEMIMLGGLHTASDRAMAQLYRLLVQDSLSAVIYPAYLAGLGYAINVGQAGYEVSVVGYQDNQLELLDTVLNALLTLKIDPERFATLKASLIRDWNNMKKERPYSQAFAALTDTLRSDRWPQPMLASALQNVQPTDLERWRDAKLAAFSVTGLLHGNVDDTNAQALVQLLQEDLNIDRIERYEAQVRDVPAPLLLPMDIDHDDASIVLHAQDPDDSFASRARSALAAQLLQPAYFQELRTEQQLGYVVSVTNRPVVRRGGISFVVQSPVASAGALEEATLRFLDDFIEHWPQVSAAEFDSQKAGLLNRLLQTPKNLNEQTQLYWSDLLDRQLTFDSQERIAEQVRVLSQSDMAEFFDGLRDQLSQRRLLIYSSGKFSETPTLGRTLESPVAPF